MSRLRLKTIGISVVVTAVILGTGLMLFSALMGPSVIRIEPGDGSIDISRDVIIRAHVHIPPIHKRFDAAAVSPADFKLYPVGRPDETIPSFTHVEEGGRSIEVRPLALLSANTKYVLEVSDRIFAQSKRRVGPYTVSFTTGDQPESLAPQVQFARTEIPGTEGRHTSLVVGPDDKLYATGIDGVIRRWEIKDDGTLTNLEIIPTIWLAEGRNRLLIGFTFDPSATADNLIAWASHSSFGLAQLPDWGGKITRLTGPNLEKAEDFVVNLPRSTRDHMTNGLAFGPDGALYVSQGSNTSTGSPDPAWGDRPERALSAAILRVDIDALRHGGKLPLDVKSDEGGTYDPFKPEAPVTVFASGIRNGYDLVWHSNGSLYVPNNGAAKGGRAPQSEAGALRADGRRYAGPTVPALKGIDYRSDYLFRIPFEAENGRSRIRYYGHPNPTRGEYVLDGGNPTASVDPAEVAQYPIGVAPDEAWHGYVFDFGSHASPNGIIEYKSGLFGGALKGHLIVALYGTSGHGNLYVLKPTGDNLLDTSRDIVGIPGLNGFSNPLDLTENLKTGDLYVSDFIGAGGIVLLRPSEAPLDPDVRREENKFARLEALQLYGN